MNKGIKIRKIEEITIHKGRKRGIYNGREVFL